MKAVNPDFGPGIHERVWGALKVTDEDIDACHTVKSELKSALGELLEVALLSSARVTALV